MSACVYGQGQPLVPWCLPNTADRHNGWRGLFGRLDYNGHFPTSVTDPQPMGKVPPTLHTYSSSDTTRCQAMLHSNKTVIVLHQRSCVNLP